MKTEKLENIGVKCILPFEHVDLFYEILQFDDDVILMHLKDESGNDWLAYWVDFDKTHKRWMFIQISFVEILGYLSDTKSLRDIYQQSVDANNVYLIDENCGEGWYHNCSRINEIPDMYLAGYESFYRYGLPEIYKQK